MKNRKSKAKEKKLLSKIQEKTGKKRLKKAVTSGF